MKYNYDACCENCGSYTRKGTCRKAMNTNIDYSVNDNPHCWDWTRSVRSMFSNLVKMFKKVAKTISCKVKI